MKNENWLFKKGIVEENVKDNKIEVVFPNWNKSDEEDKN